ncbi:hypothetical protein EAO70_36550 [Streptomyces sp. adm13(2018)]|uniref:hypothetical protein n=1 Tax=Streptomyces sp. adm13(2018) TaxID=2479007 RepID=UPI0011CDB538|nr:hypothetical protein [Streptomyces sp. adm13(2018)]TXS06879.1 hypothetical protein EAO70_36550 [Streptomyces sp. adm13(2018)]
MSSIEETDRPERLSTMQRVVDKVRIVTLQGEIDHTTKDMLPAALLKQDDTVLDRHPDVEHALNT